MDVPPQLPHKKTEVFSEQNNNKVKKVIKNTGMKNISRGRCKYIFRAEMLSEIFERGEG